MQFTPKNGRPLLFLSSQTLLSPGKAIRGGVPVIFPWFGPREGHPESPMHGLVRTRMWTVEDIQVPDHSPATIRLSFHSTEETLALWPHHFQLTLEYRLGSALEVCWRVQNTGETPFQFEQALHPYFPIADIHAASVTGLQRAEYIDKADQLRLKKETAPVIRFTAETDRLYFNTETECVLEDSSAETRLHLQKRGAMGTVVWNPWIAKAAALPDLADQEWQSFVCVEQVNAGPNAVILAPGAVHELRARYAYDDAPQEG